MKKIFLFLLISLIFIPLNAYAANIDISITCPDGTLIAGRSMICTVDGNSTDNISGISFKITTSNGLILDSVTIDSSLWQGNGNDGNVDIYTDTNKSGEFNIASFKVTAIEDIEDTEEIKISDGSFSDGEFNNTSFDDVAKNISVVFNDDASSDDSDDTDEIDNDDMNNEVSEDTDETSEDNSDDSNNPKTSIYNNTILIVFCLIFGIVIFKIKGKLFV